MAKQSITLSGRNSSRANTAFTIGLFAILAALAFQYIGGYQPCELCYAQRTPYYVGLPLLAVLIALWDRIPVPWRIAATLAVAAIFAWGTYMGAYHAGVEWGFWPGPTSCTGLGEGINFGDLGSIDDSRVVPCDQPQVRFLGLSFAGLNALASLAITGFLLWSAQGQYARMKKEAAKKA